MRAPILLAAALAAALGSAGQASAATLEARLAEYRQRVELLKDKDAVENSCDSLVHCALSTKKP